MDSFTNQLKIKTKEHFENTTPEQVYQNLLEAGYNPNTKYLYLTLKKKWFDLILFGDKIEEYREIKDYWIKRFYGLKGKNLKQTVLDLIIDNSYQPIHYDYIIFKNGYDKDSPQFTCECKEIKVGYGNVKWGAPNKLVFIIKLGNIFDIKNVKETKAQIKFNESETKCYI